MSSRRQIHPRIAATKTWIDEDNCESAFLFGPDLVTQFRRMLSEGQTGLFGWFEGRPIAYCWAIIGKTATPVAVNDLVSLQEGQAYIHFCHTHEQYRGKSLYPWLLSVMTEHLFEQRHVRTTVIDTTAESESSQRGILKVGFQPIRVFDKLMFLGKQLALTKTDL